MNAQWKVLAGALAAALVLSGCSSVSLDEGAKEGTLAGETPQTQVQNPFTDPSHPLSHRSVYFAFDSYDVPSEYAPYVEAHAKWLNEHPDVNIVIQGNTDERGGREYNLAARRARFAYRSGLVWQGKARGHGLDRRGLGSESSCRHRLSAAVHDESRTIGPGQSGALSGRIFRRYRLTPPTGRRPVAFGFSRPRTSGRSYVE